MIRFRSAIWAIVALFFVHGIALCVDAYHQWIWFDIPMHFFGGYVVGMFAMALYGWVRERVDIRPKSVPRSRLATIMLECGFVIGFAVIIGVGWEWFEFLVDQFATSFVQKYGNAQMGLADTMDDLLNDTIGAITAWMLWRTKD